MKKKSMGDQPAISPKVLFIGAVWPEPKSSAGGSRMMHLIHVFIDNQFDVHYCSAASTTDYMSDLCSLGITTFSVQLNDSSFDDQLMILKPDVVIFDRFMVEEQFGWRVAQCCPSAVRIIETIDLHCLRLGRKEALKLQGGSDDALETILKESDVAKREIAAILRSDLSIMISTAEMEVLKTVFNIDESLLFYLPFKAGEKQGGLLSFEQREGYMTIGNFKHAPNWDSVLQLKQKVWPLIRKKQKNAQLYVYGSYADDKVMQLNDKKNGFHVLGRAEDALEVVKKARVCLAPLRFGAGIKGKLVESMMCGTPNVTTDIGAEGMKENLEWNGLIENDLEKFSQAAIELYSNKKMWLTSQENGFHLLHENFEPSKQEVFLFQRIEELKLNLSVHRKKNFMGAMLMHHTMQSTKFMSRWIEEKNK